MNDELEFAEKILSGRWRLNDRVAKEREWKDAAQGAVDGDVSELDRLLDLDALFDFYLDEPQSGEWDYTFKDWVEEQGGFKVAAARYLEWHSK